MCINELRLQKIPGEPFLYQDIHVESLFKSSDMQAGLSDISAEIRARLGGLELHGSHRRFLVNRMGGTGSSWLVKLLNTHPEVFCYHEGVIVRTYPSSSYGSDDIVSFIGWLAEDDMKSAYRAVGDVGSAWLGHVISIPKELFTTGILLRHPARILNTRLKVFEKDNSFTEINAECLKRIQQTWGINAHECGEMDQIFLQDLYNLKMQIDASSSVDIVIQLELMTTDVDYCADMLHRLTGQYYELSLIEPILENPVNRRTQSSAPVTMVLNGFTEQQRRWYGLILQESVLKVGYELEDDLRVAYVPTPATAAAHPERSLVTRDLESTVLKQAILDRDRQIARLRSQVEELEHIWRAVQASTGWRLLNLWRGVLKRLLPAGTRARKMYESVLRRFRGSAAVNQ